MSLRKDQSHEIIALDAVAAQHRHGQQAALPGDVNLKSYAAILHRGTPVSVVRLSARAPWFDGLAALYCFNASRWDTPQDQIYCYPNQAPAGGWDGTVVYVDFTPPAEKTYSIVVSFGGPNAIAHLRGPWGVVDKTVPAGQESATVGVLWTGDVPLWFTITFSGAWLGTVAAVQIFEMT